MRKEKVLKIKLVLFYINWVITICAETGFVPPAKGVIVSAVVLFAGFLTVNIEFGDDANTFIDLSPPFFDLEYER